MIIVFYLGRLSIIFVNEVQISISVVTHEFQPYSQQQQRVCAVETFASELFKQAEIGCDNFAVLVLTC